MYEKPLERLNYFNGQRLEASDLKTEQDYHIRTRRWLNKSLYSAGIARGLEVRAVPRDPAKQDDPPRVGVSLGLAIDDDGREIILLEKALIEVCSYSGSGESTVVGNYLVIEYAEETQAFEKSAGCAVRETGARTSVSTTNFGGPSRVQAKPKFSWIPFPPQPGSNQIALARVELGSDCATVHQIDPGIRRYIGAASAAKVRQYALEGERHIDKDNSGRIYFHIRGRQPNSVTLYLRAEKFSTLYYTEMGWHEHSKTLTGNTITGAASAVDEHAHTEGTLGTAYKKTSANPDDDPIANRPDSGNHTGEHHVWAHVSAHPDPSDEANFWEWIKDPLGNVIKLIEGINKNKEYAPNLTPIPGDPMPSPYALRIITKTKSRYVNLKENVAMGVYYGRHEHMIKGKTGNTTDVPALNNLHTHTLDTSLTIDKSGVDQASNDYKARSGNAEKAITYIDNLQVWIGKSISQLDNKTDAILGQLRDAQQGLVWDKLGNGKNNHVLALEGTGAIRLDFLPDVTFTDREYVIDLKVASGGGRILYNLYIE